MLGIIISGVITCIIFILEFIFTFMMKIKLRMIFKPMCMASLGVLAYFLGITNIGLFVALGFCLLGDIFLMIKTKKKLFVIGMLAFFLGHIAYTYVFSSYLTYDIKVWHIVALSILGLLFPLVTYKTVEPYVKKLTIVGSYYFYMLIMDILFASLLMFNILSLGSILVLIGVIIFTLSDTTILLSKYIIKIKHSGAIVIGTYLIAQLLIVIGISLL